ncbi:hypothetical protein [Actinomadura sp. WMMA1423]|uniref:hypothetical protein n=1 Tax=Actinomadura sp. WMMA1423 TaxID=2591108 RepID=UPI00143CE576|nr:hypothetical protein [Actinomadura sp. WMMA1423]
MSIRVVCEAEAVTLTWTLTEEHSHRFTREDLENALDENGCLDPDELASLCAEIEGDDTYDYTLDRSITEIKPEGLELVA